MQPRRIAPHRTQRVGRPQLEVGAEDHQRRHHQHHRQVEAEHEHAHRLEDQQVGIPAQRLLHLPLGQLAVALAEGGHHLRDGDAAEGRPEAGRAADLLPHLGVEQVAAERDEHDPVGQTDEGDQNQPGQHRAHRHLGDVVALLVRLAHRPRHDGGEDGDEPHQPVEPEVEDHQRARPAERENAHHRHQVAGDHHPGARPRLQVAPVRGEAGRTARRVRRSGGRGAHR